MRARGAGAYMHCTAGAIIAGCTIYEQLKDDVENLNIIGEAVDDPYTFSSGLGIDVICNIEYPDDKHSKSVSPYTKEELAKSLQEFGEL